MNFGIFFSDKMNNLIDFENRERVENLSQKVSLLKNVRSFTYSMKKSQINCLLSLVY